MLDGVAAGDEMIVHSGHGGQITPARDAGFENSIRRTVGSAGGTSSGLKSHDGED